MDQNKLVTDVACHICGAAQLNSLLNYPSLPRVTSDCLPWRQGGKLAICKTCSCVQNPLDDAWHSETSEIYSKYQIYRQSAGSEQGVFAEGKKLVPRSAKIFQRAASYLDLTKKGRLLDIGCANGELLRCFSSIAPHWTMVGFEYDDKRRAEVESIPGVESFAWGSLDKINEPFDIITLIHVLEHLPRPGAWLKDLHRILKPNGLVIIQVPDPKINPYNLLVADHCSHFIIPDLINIAEQAGYRVIACSDKWVSREFSLLITPLESSESKHVINQFEAIPGVLDCQNEHTVTYPNNAVKWLHEVVKLAKEVPHDKPRGIWGTAIAATWLYSVMDGKVDFFVDEDSHRIGQQHLGRPIYSPEKVPKGSHIFVALTPEIAANIVSRWSHLDVTLRVPPDLVY